MTYHPRLREHVRIERRDDGTAGMVDGVAKRRLELSPAAAELALRLDGRPFAEAVATPGDAIVFRRLLLLNAVAGAGDAIVERLARVRRGQEELGLQLLASARFACQGSGECCQNYVFGPLDDDDLERLAALDLRTAFPHLGDDPYIEIHKAPDGLPLQYLRSVDDRCVFLQNDRRCGLHVRFGAQAKPNLCRLYPIETLATYDGLRIYDRGSCATFAVSARTGLPLVDDLDRLRPLLPQEVPGLYHPIVHVADHSCDYGHFDRFAKVCLRLVGRGLGTAPETLRAIGRGLGAFARALGAFALAPGEPDATLALALGEPEKWYDGEPSDDVVRVGAEQLSQSFELLLTASSGVISAGVAKKGYLAERLLREVVQLFHAVAGLCSHLAEPAQPRDPYFTEIAAVTVPAAEVDEVLRLSLRQHLFSHRCLVNEHALAGTLRLAFTQILAVAGARVRAAAERRAVAAAPDLSWGHMLAARVLATSFAGPLLLRAEQHFAPMLEALPAVLALAT